jgi:hypothetical protein
MLKWICCIANPGFQWRHKLTQIIGMPVFGFIHAQMAEDPCPHTTRSEGAANIDVVAGL